MALQQTIIHNIRLVGPTEFNTYVKVATVTGTKEQMSIEVKYLKDGPAGELIQALTFEFEPDMLGPNFIQQAYQFLKTLPEFSNAVDC